MINKKVLILDLDNTLYDWNDAYSSSFMALVNYHQKIFSLSESEVINNFKRYFKKKGTLELLPTFEYIQSYKNSNFKESDLQIIANESCQFFLNAWKQNIQLYSEVYETLKVLKIKGVKIIAFSDVSMFWATYRLNCLKILSDFDKIYAPIDNIILPDYVKTNPMKYRVIDEQQRKPNSAVIAEIIKYYNTNHKNTFMLGDNLNKDMKCAYDIKIISIWAKYGTKHGSTSGKILRSITPWTKSTTPCLITPDYTIDSFSEVLKIVFQ